jgi:hypothetical protein
MNIKTYGLPAEKSSKTEYAEVENLLGEVVIMDFLKWHRKLRS